MPKSLFVGNLPYSISEQELHNHFEPFGQVHSAKIITDRFTGQSRGFGFVEMEEPDALAAMDALNNSNLAGRNIRISEAKPRAPQGAPRGGGGGDYNRY